MGPQNILIINEDSQLNIDLHNNIRDLLPDPTITIRKANSERINTYISKMRPDLILMNINAEKTKIYHILNANRHLNFQLILFGDAIKFETNLFRYNPIDFINLPIEMKYLKYSVQRAQKRIKEIKHAENFLTQKSKNDSDFILKIASIEGFNFIHVNNIMRLEADGPYTHIHLVNGKKLVSSTNLGKYEKLLWQKSLKNHIRFFRIHYKHIINLNQVSEYINQKGSIMLGDGSILKIAQRRIREFKLIWQ